MEKFWKNGDLWRFPIPQIIQGMADHEWQKWNRRGSRLLKRSPARPPPARPVHTEVPGAAERSVLLPDPATILRGGQGQRASNVIKYHQISSNINKCHQISSNVIKYHQISSNIINYHQISSNVIKYHQVSSNGTTTWALFWGGLYRSSDCSELEVLLKLSACHPHPAHRSRREAAGISPIELDQVAPWSRNSPHPAQVKASEVFFKVGSKRWK